VKGTERIVEAVAKYDVDRYIHVSSYNADPSSASEFYATKGLGEQVARSIFPETTLVRPAPMFGFEDNLLLKLAGVMNLFTSNHLKERYRPVHVIDIGRALERMLFDDSTVSQTFELCGPNEYSTAEIAEMVDREIYKTRRHINLPKAILKPIAGIMNSVLYWPTLSADEIEREFIDQKIDETAKTFKDLGISPGDIADFTYHYLVSNLDKLFALTFFFQYRLQYILPKFSKDTAAQPTTISLLQLRRRSARNASTFMFSTTSKAPKRRSIPCVWCRVYISKIDIPGSR
jgi:NADH dehydrogenase (ubiquinone) 1 alpha subcomplex subunit 9